MSINVILTLPVPYILESCITGIGTEKVNVFDVEFTYFVIMCYES